MLQLTGSALILAAALWLQRSFHLRTLLRQRTLRALSGAFLALESAVRLTLTPLPALLRHLSCEPEAAGFFEGVTANLARGEPLASAWEHAAKTLPIAARERETVSALGHALGGDEESVCAALTLAASELSRLEEKLRQRERETGRITAALCFSNKINRLEFYHNSSWLEYGGAPDKAARSGFVSAIDAWPVFLPAPKKVRARVAACLERVHAESLIDKRIGSLSGGELQRVLLAMALEPVPHILILDEPAAGLDPRGREEILGGIRRYQRERRNTVIIVSHSMEDMARYADRITVVSEGALFRTGTPAEIFSDAASLSSVGLDVPQITHVMLRLAELGVPVRGGIYTVADARDELMRLYSERTKK